MKFLKVGIVSLLAAAVCLSLAFHQTEAAVGINPNYKTFVMAPLEKITNWNSFKNQLVTLKNNGVYAITTDVWWGDIESKGENQFDWSYYKTYADTVREAGLKWVPIMSTHQCGGNVGDTVNIPIPSWVWTKDSEDNMEVKDENGNYDKEALSPWWTGTEKLYDEIYKSFDENFNNYKDIIAKIYISSGPSGELRYPSYNSEFGWTYPNRGYLECYSMEAKKDFQNAMKNKYPTITALNSAWGTTLTDFTQITPPTDGDNFFINGAKTQYGCDFLTWYQGTLTKELKMIAEDAHFRFDSVFGVRIGAKVAGVHWLINSPTMPHAAEYCAGYYNYNTLLDQFKASDIDLTFTCLEMDDSKSNTNPYYSAPESLVENVATIANSKGISHFGENALAISNNSEAYNNIAKMLFNYNFSGFTLLRLSNIENNNGAATSEMSPFVNSIVMKPVPVNFKVNNANTIYGQNVYVTGDRWELGGWDIGTYPKALNYSNGSWTETIYLGEGRTYNFKGIKKDNSYNTVWEGGENHCYTVPIQL